MKNFARVVGLLFGSARAHTYPKSGQVAPHTPSVGRHLECEKLSYENAELISVD